MTEMSWYDECASCKRTIKITSNVGILSYQVQGKDNLYFCSGNCAKEIMSPWQAPFKYGQKEVKE